MPFPFATSPVDTGQLERIWDGLHRYNPDIEGRGGVGEHPLLPAPPAPVAGEPGGSARPGRHAAVRARGTHRKAGRVRPACRFAATAVVLAVITVPAGTALGFLLSLLL
ncbi:hypothetical protein AB0H73_23405 [Streptomyces olivoreticuli]